MTADVVAATSNEIRRRITARWTRRGGCKAHTHAADTVQVARIRRGLAELAPQPGQVHVDRPVASSVGLAPHVGEQLTLRDHLSRPLRQGQQQVELLARQVDRHPVETDLARPRVDRQAAHHQRAFGDGGATSTKNRTEPGVDLFDPERLDHVVVGATVQGLDDVGVIVAGGDDDHWHLTDRPQHRKNLQPIEVGQTEVEQHDVGRVVDGGLQPGHTSGARRHRVAQVGQCPGHRRPDARIVLDQQDCGHDRTLRRVMGCRRESGTVAPWW